MAMDVALIQHAQACGVTFLPGCAARLEPGQGNTRTLIAGEQRIESAVVIAADGLGGTLAGPTTAETGSRIGAGVVLPAPAFYQPGIIYMTTGPGGYLGLVLLEDGQLDLACALDREATRRAGGPAALAAALLQRAGWPVPERMETAAWRGTPPLTRAPRSVSGHRLFVVGDASGYVEPFTGEGMAWALSSAVALAPLAAQNWTPRLAQQWIQLHRHVVVHRQLPCRTLAAVLRRPWLMNWLVRMLKVWPALASPLTHTLNRSPLEV
jgi:2-polyprenyl-6-methoxyphenol hydroxylase-like FAD-dependent oxidoreductase